MPFRHKNQFFVNNRFASPFVSLKVQLISLERLGLCELPSHDFVVERAVGQVRSGHKRNYIKSLRSFCMFVDWVLVTIHAFAFVTLSGVHCTFS